MTNYNLDIEGLREEMELEETKSEPCPPQPEWEDTSLEPWVNWANWILDHGGHPDPPEWREFDDPETVANFKEFAVSRRREKAWSAEIEQLRQRYPEFADHLHVREKTRHRGRPPKHPPSKNKDPVKAAAAEEADINTRLAAHDVQIIRKLYQQHFDRRNRKLPPSPEVIAAARWGVDPEKVRERKRRGTPKPRTK